MAAIVARRALVTGRVQGVFFRAATGIEATRLGVRGYARNLTDGSVEVLAVGSAEAVATLTAWLHRGPPSAAVASVVVEELNPAEVTTSLPAGFERR